MAEIYDKAESFKAALLRRERAASSQMVRAYGQAWNRLSKLLLVLTERIGDAASANEPISPAWLYRQERYARLMNEIERQIKRFAATAEQSILREQQAAVRVALKHSTELVKAAAPEIGASFISLNVSAVENIVGFLSNGAPLKRLLDELPGDAGRRTAEALTEAVTLGYNPRKTAANIRHTLGMTLTRALTIARTETLRSYREATHANYRANEDVVGGWYWAATLGPRTCAACIAMHGTFHSLDERLAAHVNCRCTQIPAIKGRPSPIAQDGEQWFAAQSDAVKARILGTQAGFKAYQAGDLALTDLVGLQSSPVWGQAYHQLGVGKAKAGQGRHPGYGGAPRPANALPAEVLPLARPLPRVTFEPEPTSAANLIAELFGPDADRAQIAGAAGALDDSVVKFAAEGRRLVVYVRHPEVAQQVRHFYQERNQLILYNELFVKGAASRPNIGAEMLARQVEFAPGLGFKQIATEAAGSIDSLFFTGYRVWPGYGYDAPIPLALRPDLPASLRQARTILDLYESEAGRLWWKQNGLSLKMKFDLTPGSRSRRVLERLLAAREKK